MKFENPKAQALWEKHISNKRWIRTVAIATLVVAFVAYAYQNLI